MFRRLQEQYQGAMWVFACVVLGLPQLALLAKNFGDGADSPLGRLAKLVAAQFTQAPSLLSAGSDRQALTYTLTLAAFGLALLIFTLLAWWRTKSPRLTNLLLGVQLALALAGDTNLCYVLAAQLGTLASLANALRWMLAQGLLYASVRLLLVIAPQARNDQMFGVAMVLIGTEILVQLLIMAGIAVASRERRNGQALALAHAELLATQALLGETVRNNERLRIARDLHDVVGHHLTALKLHIDLASRQAGMHAPPALHTANELASSLLAEVRVLVSAERNERHIDLRTALETLCKGIPAPRIELDIEPQLDIESAALAHTLFRCVQEAISNAMRHAHASQMRIVLRRDAQGLLQVDISDNGQGSRAAPEGNGLRGMRERLAQWGGDLRAGDCSNGGFALQLRLPAGVAA